MNEIYAKETQQELGHTLLIHRCDTRSIKCMARGDLSSDV
jgi:hypothetical protein